MFKITKEFEFEMAHILEDHKGKCLNLHGHSYKLQAVVYAYNCKDGMVLDFSDLKNLINKEIIEKVDHAFGYNINSRDEAEKEITQILLKHNRLVYAFPNKPTAENMAEHFFHIIKPLIKDSHCKLHSVIVYETATSFAEYCDTEE